MTIFCGKINSLLPLGSVCLKFQFVKETGEVIRAEKRRMDKEIQNLTETTICLYSRTFKVNHELMFTMLDGKTAQSLTPAASSCFVCGVTTSQMNKLDLIRNISINKDGSKNGYVSTTRTH